MTTKDTWLVLFLFREIYYTGKQIVRIKNQQIYMVDQSVEYSLNMCISFKCSSNSLPKSLHLECFSLYYAIEYIITIVQDCVMMHGLYFRNGSSSILEETIIPTKTENS